MSAARALEAKRCQCGDCLSCELSAMQRRRHPRNHPLRALPLPRYLQGPPQSTTEQIEAALMRARLAAFAKSGDGR